MAAGSAAGRLPNDSDAPRGRAAERERPRQGIAESHREVIARTVVPYVNIPMPDGTRQTGIADIQEQLYFTPRKPGFFTWGLGPILSIPTATSDVARTGQWALGPTAVGLVDYKRWVVGLLANNLWRVGGVNNGPPINQFTTQPFINFNIPLG